MTRIYGGGQLLEQHDNDTKGLSGGGETGAPWRWPIDGVQCLHCCGGRVEDLGNNTIEGESDVSCLVQYVEGCNAKEAIDSGRVWWASSNFDQLHPLLYIWKESRKLK